MVQEKTTVLRCRLTRALVELMTHEKGQGILKGEVSLDH
jgi:hypothetical protein